MSYSPTNPGGLALVFASASTKVLGVAPNVKYEPSVHELIGNPVISAFFFSCALGVNGHPFLRYYLSVYDKMIAGEKPWLEFNHGFFMLILMQYSRPTID